MNRAIDTLPDLNAKWREFEPKLALLKQQWAKDHPVREGEGALTGSALHGHAQKEVAHTYVHAMHSYIQRRGDMHAETVGSW